MSLPDTEHEPRPRRPREPDLYMPAMPPLGLIHALETRVRAWARRWRQRRRAISPHRSGFGRDASGRARDHG